MAHELPRSDDVSLLTIGREGDCLPVEEDVSCDVVSLERAANVVQEPGSRLQVQECAALGSDLTAGLLTEGAACPGAGEIGLSSEVTRWRSGELHCSFTRRRLPASQRHAPRRSALIERARGAAANREQSQQDVSHAPRVHPLGTNRKGDRPFSELGDVLPGSSGHDYANGFGMYAEFLGEMRGAFIGCSTGTDSSHVSLCELRTRVSRAWRRCPIRSALGFAILHVVRRRSGKQMIGSDAQPIVAVMADVEADRNVAVCHSPRFAMGERPFLLSVEGTVTGTDLTPDPVPASISVLDDARPEPLFRGLSNGDRTPNGLASLPPMVVGAAEPTRPSIPFASTDGALHA